MVKDSLLDISLSLCTCYLSFSAPAISLPLRLSHLCYFSLSPPDTADIDELIGLAHECALYQPDITPITPARSKQSASSRASPLDSIEEDARYGYSPDSALGEDTPLLNAPS